MCGRYTLTVSGHDLAREYSTDPGEPSDWQPVFSLAPSNRVPAVREYVNEDGQLHRELIRMSWGLRPSWAKEKGPRPINARLETAASKPLFRASFSKMRAVIPMSGYYEWIPEDGKKQPYYLHREDHTILHAAGLYAARKDKDEQWQLSCAIITTDAKDAAGEVHDRMPVFLSEELASDWLHPGPLDSAEEMTARLADAAEAGAQSLQVRKVSQRVNNTRTVDRTDPTLISAID
ncbi:SOS response-associated peptidase [Brevibacterium luteolum]|uniref:Abasic site processing protein n=1 Tax=Brevibacterium luteolum TaxID=199591 RepID=A0A6G8KX88_9MICO|nr:SOS response-associated peptidase [Brevibacterium luteolum]QIN29241.1 SOS response-associated peptidase [Brevibacterium luteolum]